jgi:aspartate/methionine/tyrosine aminotransferase
VLSDRVSRIGASATLKISAKAKAMRAEGIDVVDMSVGQPDFETPRHVKAAGHRAIDENKTGYTPNPGTPDVRKAIARWLRTEHGLAYDIREILVSNGAKQSLYNLMMAVVSEGDEVIIPAPYWVSYPEMVELAGGVPVILGTREEDGFRITPDRLRAAISPSTKLLMLNSPSNPTGSAYTRAQLEAIAQVVVEEDILVVSDEIYSQLVFDGFQFTAFASLGEEVRRRTITINGASKAFAMTGWRIGFAAGPELVISSMAKVQSHATSNACSISQEAAREAFEGPQFEITCMAMEFSRRRNFLHQRVCAWPGVSCHRPEGAFYLFPNVSALYGMEYDGVPLRNSYGMAYFLLREARVAVVPGDAFGCDDFIRLSYATSMGNLKKAADRIDEALKKLKPARRVRERALQNTFTRVGADVPVEAGLLGERRDALVAEVESFLRHDNYFEWNANINGIMVQLRTNIPHLYDFFLENFYPGELESDIEPHAVLYAVDGVSGREPHVYYDAETRTGLLVNSDWYGQCRSLALGLAADMAERMGDAHALRGMSLDVGGRGLILVGPAKTMKTELTFGLLGSPGVRLMSLDLAFARYAGGTATLDVPERKLYLATKSAAKVEALGDLFERSKCENVVTSRDDCKRTDCPIVESCDMERGDAFCFTAAKGSAAMLDPYWIGGAEKHTKRTALKWVVLLEPDGGAPLMRALGAEEALHTLEGAATRSGAGGHPYLNPHILVRTDDRLAQQRRLFERLFGLTRVHALRTGGAGFPEALSELKRLVGIA